jgi:N6-L-threonylcarbamoyladenine synthase
MQGAKVSWSDLAAVAVTAGPGLVGSLLVGMTFAKAICAVRGIPLIGVNHIEGHIHAVFMEVRQGGGEVKLPALALVASGGHTHLFRIDSDGTYYLLGKTRDDAAGEAYDKVAKLLGFGYPGGPVLDRLAPFGDPKSLRLPFAKMKGNDLDFSFSGLKTAMLRWVQSKDMQGEVAARKAFLKENADPTIEQWISVTPKPTLDAVAAFQRVVVEELVKRVARAVEEAGARSVIVAGGVACNAGLRKEAQGGRIGCPVYFPKPSLSTDNAAMIAAAAIPRLLRGDFDDLSLKAHANLTLA